MDADLGPRLAEVSPAFVLHLAASTSDDVQSVRSGFEATHNLLLACAALPKKPWVVVASSSAVYGPQAGQRPIREFPPSPVSLYGLSKVVAESVSAYAWHTFNLPVVCARLFNVIGPGQSASRVLARFGQQLAKIEAGLQPPVVHTGRLDAVRDFIDVRDVVSALRLLTTIGEPGSVYNVGSGRGIRVQDALRRMMRLAKVPDVQVQSVAASKSAISWQRSDCRRLKALGWRCEVSFNQSLRDILDDWRTRVKSELTC